MRLVHTCTSWRQDEKKNPRDCVKGRCWKCWNEEVAKQFLGLDKRSITTALGIFTFACFPESPPELAAVYKLISPIDCYRHQSDQTLSLIEELASYNFDTKSCYFPYPDGFCMSNCLFLMMWNDSKDFYDHEKAWNLLRDKILEWEVAGQITPEIAKDLTRGDITQFSNPNWTLIEDEELREELELSPFSYEGALPLLCKTLGMGLAMMDDPWKQFRVVHPAKCGNYLVRCTIPRSKSLNPEHFEKIRHFFIARLKDEDCELVLREHDHAVDIPMKAHGGCETVDLAQENEDEKQRNSDGQDERGDIEMGGVEDEVTQTRTCEVDAQSEEHLAERSVPRKGKILSRDDLTEVENDLKEAEVRIEDEERELVEDASFEWDVADGARPQRITNRKNQELELLGLGRLDPRVLNGGNEDHEEMRHEGTGEDDGMANENTGKEDIQNEVVELRAEVPDMKENAPNQAANHVNVEQGNGDDFKGFEVGDAPNAPILPEKDATNQTKGTKKGTKGTKKGNTSNKNRRNGRGKDRGGKELGHGGGLKRQIGSDDMPEVVPDYSVSSTPEVIVGDRSAIMTTCVFFLDGWVPEDQDISLMEDQLKFISLKFRRRITLSFSKNRRNLFKDLWFCSNQALIREVIVFGHGVQGPGETNGILGAEVRILNGEAHACEVVKFDEIISSFIRNSRCFQPDVGFVCCNYFRRKKCGNHLRRRYTNAVSEKFQAMLTLCVEEDISLYQTTVRLPEILDSFISTKTFPFQFWKPSFKVQIQWRQVHMRKYEEEKLYILECLRECKNHLIMCTNSSWLYQYLGLQWKDVNFDRFQIVHCMMRKQQTSVKSKEWLHVE